MSLYVHAHSLLLIQKKGTQVLEREMEKLESVSTGYKWQVEDFQIALQADPV